MKNYKIAVIPGDGIGVEIVPAAVEVLEKVAQKHGFTIESENFPFGAGYYLENGIFMPDNGIETLSAFDAILFGAVGLPEVDDTLPAKDYTFKVRKHFNQYINYRPVKSWPGVEGPLRGDKELDFVVVRENTEGEFVQVGGQLHPDGPFGMGVDTSIFTRQGIERIAHFSFKLAQKRRKKVHYVTKSNTLINSLAYWDRVICEVAEQYPDVDCQRMYIDAAAANFITRPQMFDVLITTNLFGDILSDLGGAMMGSLGLGGSGNINPEKDFPSMFEPIHGSAPDIAGQGIANPYGTIWSAALMLDHLGEAAAAQNIVEAMQKAMANGNLTGELKGSSKTAEIGKAVADNI